MTEGNLDPSELFAEEFSDELAKQFQDAMQGIVGNDQNFMEQIEKLAEAAGKSGQCKYCKFIFFRAHYPCLRAGGPILPSILL